MGAHDVHIVVTDRNPHVRGLLVRELLREGWRVTEARDFVHLAEIIDTAAHVDLVVLDPDICVRPRCAGFKPGTARVLLHVIDPGQCEIPPPGLPPHAACVVKGGDLTELKRRISGLLDEGPIGAHGADDV